MTLTSLPYDEIKISIRVIQQSGLKPGVFKQRKGRYAKTFEDRRKTKVSKEPCHTLFEGSVGTVLAIVGDSVEDSTATEGLAASGTITEEGVIEVVALIILTALEDGIYPGADALLE